MEARLLTAPADGIDAAVLLRVPGGHPSGHPAEVLVCFGIACIITPLLLRSGSQKHVRRGERTSQAIHLEAHTKHDLLNTAAAVHVQRSRGPFTPRIGAPRTPQPWLPSPLRIGHLAQGTGQSLFLPASPAPTKDSCNLYAVPRVQGGLGGLLLRLRQDGHDHLSIVGPPGMPVMPVGRLLAAHQHYVA